ncbi:MAG TPA: LysR substrate-binding domain-containing protein [Ilumatobacter sp.]|nr:LysR substrate-binding domain-containing protein [Ilumatobacter sp.]
MELQQLEHVVAVIDHGGFTRAAHAVGITQPSMSQSIRRLEDELGVVLFDRVGRGVQLTEAGHGLEGPARAVLRDLSTLLSTVAMHRDLDVGVLRIATIPTLAATIVAPLIARLRRLHPGVTVQVADERRPGTLIDMVSDGRCELAFADTATRRAGLQSVPLARQRLLAVLPPDSGGGGRRLSFAKFATYPLVLAPAGTAVRELLLAAFEAAGVEANIAVEMPQREAIVPLVLDGAGATVLPEAQALEAGKRGAVVRPFDPPLVRDVVVIHRDRDLAPAATEMLRLAKHR